MTRTKSPRVYNAEKYSYACIRRRFYLFYTNIPCENRGGDHYPQPVTSLLHNLSFILDLGFVQRTDYWLDHEHSSLSGVT